MHHISFLKALRDEVEITMEAVNLKASELPFPHPAIWRAKLRCIEVRFDSKLDAELVERKSCKSRVSCCGAGLEAQKFKEAEKRR